MLEIQVSWLGTGTKMWRVKPGTIENLLKNQEWFKYMYLGIKI
jgi:hypothetical protein